MGENKQAQSKEKLSKSDPEFYTKIARLAGAAILKKKGKKYFKELAKKSHPREHYNGGRPKKIQNLD